MGPIQSSLNQLTMSLLGAAVGVSKGLKKGVVQPKTNSNKQKELQPLQPADVTDYKVQSPIEYTNPAPQEMSAVMSDFAAASGNDLIAQKYRARFKSVEERKASFAKAEELSKKLADMRKKKMGGKK